MADFTAFPVPYKVATPADVGALSLTGGTLTGTVNGTKFHSGSTPSYEVEFVSNVTWSNTHGHYAFVDDSTFSFTAAASPVWGHASFNANVKFSGNQTIDHHHSFQSYPQYSGSGTVNRCAGFFSVGNHSGSGNVAEWAGMVCADPTGSGPIAVICGVKIEPFARGTAKWGIYQQGSSTSNLFTGGVEIGPEGTTGSIRYSSGDMVITPRSAFKVDVAGPMRVTGSMGIGVVPTTILDVFGGYALIRNADYQLYIGSGALLSGTASCPTLRSDTGPLLVGFGTTERFRFDSAGQFVVQTVGKGLSIKEGSNAKMGVSTLVAGTAVVSTTAVTANSRIFLTSQSDGGTPGFQRVSARTVGTNFTITSSSAADTSVVAWFIVEPS